MTPLRTLHVIDSLGTGGAERSTVELLVELTGDRLEPAVVLLRSQPEDQELVQALRDASVPVHLAPGTRIERTRALRGVIRRVAPALVHTTLIESDIAGRIAAWRSGIPVATSLVNTTYDPVRLDDPAVSKRGLATVRFVDGWSARRLTGRFHALSSAVAESAERHLGVPGQRITVIPRGRHTGRLGAPTAERRAAARAGLGLGPEAPVVVTVGRQDFQKGHDVLVEAIGRMADSRPGTVLLLAGREGAFSPAIARAAKRTKADVRFLGYRRDVPELLAAADVFAFPSRYEGLGGAVLEAMALGLPVVASNLPAVAEVVEPGTSALLVPPGDVAALAAALDRVLGDAQLAAALGRRGRALFLEHFTLEAVAPRMHRFFVDAANTVSP